MMDWKISEYQKSMILDSSMESLIEKSQYISLFIDNIDKLMCDIDSKGWEVIFILTETTVSPFPAMNDVYLAIRRHMEELFHITQQEITRRMDK